MKFVIFFISIFQILDSCHASTKDEEFSNLLRASPARQQQQSLAYDIKEELFKNVYGEKIIQNQLGDFDWDIFSKESDIEDTKYLNARNKLLKFMTNTSIEEQNDPNFYRNAFKVIKIKETLNSMKMKAPVERIRHYMTEYFTGERFQKYGYGNHIQIAQNPKNTGDQLGFTVKVSKSDDFSNNNTELFFIKSHAYGSKKQSSTSGSGALFGSSMGNVDPRELLVYKILEKLNLGCESHFFGKNLRSIYIATKSAGVHFQEYEVLKNIYVKDEAETKAILKKQNNPTKLTNENLNKKAQEETLKKFTKYIPGIIQLDLISRLLFLEDLNGKNYGFNEDSGDVKIIDFRLPALDDTTRIYDGIYRGFLEGNGPYSYDSIMYAVLKNQKPEDQTQRAFKQFKSLYTQHENAIDESIQELNNILSSIENVENTNKLIFVDPYTKQDQNTYSKIVEQYAKDIKYNFNFFKEKFEEFNLANVSTIN